MGADFHGDSPKVVEASAVMSEPSDESVSESSPFSESAAGEGGDVAWILPNICVPKPKAPLDGVEDIFI